MGNTNLIGQLENIAGFTQVNQYPAPMNALEAEWGAVGSVRFLLSSIGSVSANASALGNDVDNVFVTAMESYTCVEQDGYSASFDILELIKFLLIDLEALWGDKAQAKAA